MANKYLLSRRAKADLENIWNYTFDKWGEKQADDYINLLFDNITKLTRTPGIGKLRPDIGPEYQCMACGNHVIFYIVTAEAINIIGVPHKRMDIVSHFESQ